MEQNPLHLNELNDRLRIVQELVPGRQISLAHIIANPGKLLYQKLAGIGNDVCQGDLTTGHQLLHDAQAIIQFI